MLFTLLGVLSPEAVFRVNERTYKYTSSGVPNDPSAASTPPHLLYCRSLNARGCLRNLYNLYEVMLKAVYPSGEQLLVKFNWMELIVFYSKLRHLSVIFQPLT